MVEAASDKHECKPSQECNLLGLFVGAAEGDEEDQTHNATSITERQEDILVVWLSVDVVANTNGLKHSEDSDDFNTAVKWYAKAASFSHLVT